MMELIRWEECAAEGMATTPPREITMMEKRFLPSHEERGDGRSRGHDLRADKSSIV